MYFDNNEAYFEHQIVNLWLNLDTKPPLHRLPNDIRDDSNNGNDHLEWNLFGHLRNLNAHVCGDVGIEDGGMWATVVEEAVEMMNVHLDQIPMRVDSKYHTSPRTKRSYCPERWRSHLKAWKVNAVCWTLNMYLWLYDQWSLDQRN